MDGEATPERGCLLHSKVFLQRFQAMRIEIIEDQVDGLCIGITPRQLLDGFCKLGSRTIGSRAGEVASGLGFDRTENIGGSATLVLAVSFCDASGTCWLAQAARRRGRQQAFRPNKLRTREDCKVSRTGRERLPCGRCIRHRFQPPTTFFSRHGLRSWLSRSRRTVSRPSRGTILRLSASATTSRTLHRARPAGG